MIKSLACKAALLNNNVLLFWGKFVNHSKPKRSGNLAEQRRRSDFNSEIQKNHFANHQ